MTIHYQDELDENLEQKLLLIQSLPQRNPQKAAQGRDYFLSRVKELQVRESARLATPSRRSYPRMGRLRPSFASGFVAVAVALMVLFGVAWGSVYAAQDSLPNDFFYPVKLAEEDFRLAISNNADTKIPLLTSYTTRRVNEITLLISQGDAIPEELAYRLESQTDELLAILAEMDDTSMQQELAKLQITLRDQEQAMTTLMTSLPEGSDPQLEQLRAMMQARQQLIQLGLGDPNAYRQQFRHRENLPIFTHTPHPTGTAKHNGPGPNYTNTPGQYGPGPCEDPGACTPSGESAGPGPRAGTPSPEKDQGQYQYQHQGSVTPEKGDGNGYGPGSQNGPGPNSTQPESKEHPETDDGNKPIKTPKTDNNDNSKKPAKTSKPEKEKENPKPTKAPKNLGGK